MTPLSAPGAHPLLQALIFSLSLAVSASEPAAPLPLPVKPGVSIVSEDFTAANAIEKWRLGKGLWTVADGTLKGVEKAEDKHTAGLACQRKYHDAVIQYRFQFTGGGAKSATLLLRNQFGNLCRVIVTPALLTLQRDRPNLPKDNTEKSQLLGKAALQLKPGQWYTVCAVVHGREFAVTLQDHATLKGSHDAIDVDKTEIEFMAGGDAVLFDDLTANAIE